MITIKEEFVGGDKIDRAIELGGWQALGLWLAMKCYAAEKLTDGFVPDEDFVRLRGAPKNPHKIVPALVDCGRIRPDGSRGPGLVERRGPGWQLHDYLHHANSAEQEQERRRKERERKAAYRARTQVSSAVSDVGHDAGQNTGQRDNAPADLSRVPPGTRPRARTRAPSPAQPNPPDQDLSVGPPTGEPAALVLQAPAASAAHPKPARRWTRVPAEWQPKPEHVSLGMQLGIVGAAYDTEVAKFRDHEFAKPKSDPDACFRNWLRESISRRRQAIVVRQSEGRAADGLERQLARVQALEAEERQSGTIQTSPRLAVERKVLS